MWRILTNANRSKRQSRWCFVCWALAGLAQVGVAEVAIADDSTHIVFHDDYAKAIREAKLTQKPIFLEFRCAP